MTEYEAFKNRTIEFLGEIISKESEKPDDEADLELIGECEQLLCELCADEPSLSEAEINDRIDRLIGKPNVGKRKRFSGKRILLIAAILCATVILGVGVSSDYVMDSELFNGIMTVLGLKVGESVDINGKTYIRNGEVTEYDSFDALLEDTKLEIMYPQELPDNIQVQRILILDNGIFPIQTFFNERHGLFTIYLNGDNDARYILESTETIEVGQMEFKYRHDGNKWMAAVSDSNYTYAISCTDEADLYAILESLNY